MDVKLFLHLFLHNPFLLSLHRQGQHGQRIVRLLLFLCFLILLIFELGFGGGKRRLLLVGKVWVYPKRDLRIHFRKVPDLNSPVSSHRAKHVGVLRRPADVGHVVRKVTRLKCEDVPLLPADLCGVPHLDRPVRRARHKNIGTKGRESDAVDRAGVAKVVVQVLLVVTNGAPVKDAVLGPDHVRRAVVLVKVKAQTAGTA